MICSIFQTLVTSRLVDNNSSEARDHLANERTFLAWLRTGFAISALGILLARVDSSTGISNLGMNKAVSILFVLLGICCILLGIGRFARVQLCLSEQKYPLNGLSVLSIAVASLITFLVTSILFLIVV